jgi:hypothetical protein
METPRRLRKTTLSYKVTIKPHICLSMFNVCKETIEIAKVEYKHEPIILALNIVFEFKGKGRDCIYFGNSVHFTQSTLHF